MDFFTLQINVSQETITFESLPTKIQTKYKCMQGILGIALAVVAQTYLKQYAMKDKEGPLLHLPRAYDRAVLNVSRCKEFKRNRLPEITHIDRRNQTLYYAADCEAREKRILIGRWALGSAITQIVVAILFMAMSFFLIGKYLIMMCFLIVQCILVSTLSLWALVANQNNRPKDGAMWFHRFNKLYSFESAVPNDLLNFFLAVDILYHWSISWYFCIVYFTASHIGVKGHMKLFKILRGVGGGRKHTKAAADKNENVTNKEKETDTHTFTETKAVRLQQKTVYV